MTSASVSHATRLTKFRTRFRSRTPGWLRDIYDQSWRSRDLKLGGLRRLRYLMAATCHRSLGWPNSVAIPLGSQRSPFHIRPYSSDLAVVVGLHQHGEYEAVRRHVAAAQAIIDLGVNIGASLRLWTDWYKNARVVGVEPDLANIGLARHNIAKHASAGITLRHAAVHVKSGHLFLDGGQEPWGITTSAEPHGRAVRVDAVTVDELLGDLPARRADLLKCDIEGAERDLFHSCEGWIGRIGWIVVETHPPYTLRAMQRDLGNAGSARQLVFESPFLGRNQVGLFTPPRCWWGRDV